MAKQKAVAELRDAQRELQTMRSTLEVGRGRVVIELACHCCFLFLYELGVFLGVYYLEPWLIR